VKLDEKAGHEFDIRKNRSGCSVFCGNNIRWAQTPAMRIAPHSSLEPDWVKSLYSIWGFITSRTRCL
jgi:hypothetical protein